MNTQINSILTFTIFVSIKIPFKIKKNQLVSIVYLLPRMFGLEKNHSKSVLLPIQYCTVRLLP